MSYDFETVIDRSRAGSVKWMLMKDAMPDVADGIVPLSIGDMELKNPPELVEGLRALLSETVLGYTYQTERDKQAVVDWFEKRHRWKVDPDWIVSFDGIVPALYLMARVFAEAGDGVLYMPPVYHPFPEAIANTGRVPVPVPLVEEAGGYVMDFEALEREAANPRNTLLLFCSPHNPVHRVWRRDELERLGRICRDNGVMVVSDEIHMDFVMPGYRHHVFSEIDSSFAANSILCTAPSKTFNIAGLQVSNLIIPDAEIRTRLVNAHRNTGRFGANQLGLAACRITYERCGGWLDGVLRLVEENGRMVREFLAGEYPEVRVHGHEGTYFLWMDCRAWGVEARDLKRFFVRDAGMFLDDGRHFGSGGEGHMRINLACPSRVMAEALERWKQAGRA